MGWLWARFGRSGWQRLCAVDPNWLSDAATKRVRLAGYTQHDSDDGQQEHRDADGRCEGVQQ